MVLGCVNGFFYYPWLKHILFQLGKIHMHKECKKV